jgi:DNA-binding XRE family transcriptional regulator
MAIDAILALPDGPPKTAKTYSAAEATANPTGGERLSRTRPRRFAEWSALRRWGKLPAWERDVPGYLLRVAREAARLRQADLAARLGITQQAVAQAERWSANPTVAFMRRWAAACGASLEVTLVRMERNNRQSGKRISLR